MKDFELHMDFKRSILLWAVIGLFATLAVWAYLAKVDEVTVGEGKVIPSQQIQIVQNLEGGIVDDMLIKEGDAVKKNQVLMHIDDTHFAANQRDLLNKMVSSKLKIARLNAEITGNPFNQNALDIKGNDKLLAREIKLYQARKAEYNSKHDTLEKKLTQKKQELTELKAQQDEIESNISLVKDELAMIEELVPKGLVSKVRLFRLQRELNDNKGKLEANLLAQPRLASLIAEAKNKLKELETSYYAENVELLNTTQQELSALKENYTALTDKVVRTAVRSPVDGVVKKIHINTIGGVIKPGMNIVEIVPTDDTLMVEARIRPSDVAFLKPGSQATVKLTAYDYTIYGGLEAKLEHISADTITDEKGNSFYLIKLRTNKDHLTKDGSALPIIPGMVTSVHILNGKKSIMDYILKPLIKTKQNALRER